MSGTLYGLRRAGCIFIILGILFGIVGVMILYTTKTNFKKFYENNMYAVVAATVALSVPLTTRGVLDYLRGAESGLYAALEGYGMYWEVVSYSLVDFIPAICQLATLVFGLIRMNE